MHGKEIKHYLKNYKCTKFIKTILESTYKVIFGSPIAVRLFVESRWILNNFWHLDCYNCCYILTFYKSHIDLWNTPKITSIGPPNTEKRPFKKFKTFIFFGAFYFKKKTSDIFNFLSAKSFSKGLLLLKIWHIKVNYR